MGDFDLVMTVGSGSRLSKDAPEARDVPSDLVFTTTWQGGFKAADCTLLRELGDNGTEKPFDDVKIFARGGGQSAWEGRLQRLPRSVRRRATVQPSALGWACALEARQDARALFIDRDLGRWRAPTLTRQVVATGAPFKLAQASAANGGLRLQVPGYAWSSNSGRPWIEHMYDAGPLKVKRLVLTWNATNSSVTAASGWYFAARVADDADVSVSVGTGSNIAGSSPTTPQTLDVPVGDLRVAGLLLKNDNSSGGSAEVNYEIQASNVCVVGNSGITLTGSGPADYGVKASDALAWLIGEYCPKLKVGEFVDSEIGIPHLAFLEPQTVTTMWNAINAYHGWAWGVWEDRTVSYNPYGQGRSRTWYVRVEDGVELQQDGDDAAQLWDSIVVQYQTPTGETRTVGAPGTVADSFSDVLQVDDDTHPAVSSGNQQTYLLELGAPCILETATTVGALMLQELNLARRAGSASVAGYVEDETGKQFPAYMVRGGDQLVVTDVGDPTPRRVVEATYTHASRTVQMTLDNTLQTVEAIVAHLGARATGRL